MTINTKHGYTLIELLVVIVIIGMVAVIGFYALTSTNSSQAVTNAEMQFVADFRSIQNQVTNGADGINNKFILFADGWTAYQIFDNSARLIRQVNLPSGVTIRLPNYPGVAVGVCTANPKMTTYTAAFGASWCWICTAGSYFACLSKDWATQYAVIGSGGPASLSVCFTNGSSCTNGTVKTVTIEGNGVSVTRINPQ